jgi:sortase A
MRRHRLLLSSLLLTGAGLSFVGGQVYMSAKAALAAYLIDRAYDRHLESGESPRPWPWADTSPIARLEVPRLGIRRPVLAGASGSSLAFGLGHVSGTAHPGEFGNCAIAGHRDTWAGFLKELRRGDVVRLRTRAGLRRYSVIERLVISKEDLSVLEPSDDRRLTLVTCYPFSGILNSPWRIAVVCRSIGDCAQK